MCSRRMFSTVRGMPLSARKSSRSTIDARYDLIVLGALRVARSDSSNPVAWRARSPAVDSATLVVRMPAVWLLIQLLKHRLAKLFSHPL